MREYIYGQILLGEIERIGEIKSDALVISCNEEKISEFLDIKYLTKEEELRDLRNLLVKTLSDRINVIREMEKGARDKKKYYDQLDEQLAIMTVVTGIIDNALWRNGYPV